LSKNFLEASLAKTNGDRIKRQSSQRLVLHLT
jgi:hypothetical protein